jgi:hypothetical protein
MPILNLRGATEFTVDGLKERAPMPRNEKTQEKLGPIHDTSKLPLGSRGTALGFNEL